MGSANSNIVEVTLVEPTTATPTFSPAPGTYDVIQDVEILDATPDAVIYFTDDDSTPTLESPVYSTALVVADSQTLKAIAQAPGYLVSALATGPYVIDLPAPTTFIIDAGTHGDGASGYASLYFAGNVLDNDHIGSLVSGTAQTYIPDAFIQRPNGTATILLALIGAAGSLSFTLNFLDGAGTAQTLTSAAATENVQYGGGATAGTYWQWPIGTIAAFVNGTNYTVTVT